MPRTWINHQHNEDCDFMTVLLQDDVGGLQEHHQGQWFDVPPTPGALVANVRDLLQASINSFITFSHTF